MTADETAKTIGRLLDTWSAATGSGTPVPQADGATLGYVRELGHYLGETLYATGKDIGALDTGMDPARQMALEQGIIEAWLGMVRRGPETALAVLAVVARVLHAAVDGARASGKCDVDDAHRYVSDLQDCLAAIAGGSGVVEEALRVLAHGPRGDR